MCCSISASFCNYTVHLVHFIFLKLTNKNIPSVQILIRTFYCKERPRKPCFFWGGGECGKGAAFLPFSCENRSFGWVKAFIIIIIIIIIVASQGGEILVNFTKNKERLQETIHFGHQYSEDCLNSTVEERVEAISNISCQTIWV